MTLWPPPRRVEEPDAAPPLVVPEGVAVGLQVTGLDGSAIR